MHTEREREREREAMRHGEINRERGRAVKTTLIGHKKSKSFKTQFCRRRLSNSFLLVSTKSKIRI